MNRRCFQAVLLMEAAMPIGAAQGNCFLPGKPAAGQPSAATESARWVVWHKAGSFERVARAQACVTGRDYSNVLEARGTRSLLVVIESLLRSIPLVANEELATDRLRRIIEIQGLLAATSAQNLAGIESWRLRLAADVLRLQRPTADKLAAAFQLAADAAPEGSYERARAVQLAANRLVALHPPTGLRLLERAEALAKEHREVAARCLQLAASLARAERRLDIALQKIDEAVETLKQVLPRGHNDIGDVLQARAALLRSLGLNQEALMDIQACVNIRSANLHREHVDTIGAYQLLAAALQGNGQTKAASQTLNRFSRLLHLDPASVEHASVHQDYALYCQESDELAASRLHYEKCEKFISAEAGKPSATAPILGFYAKFQHNAALLDYLEGDSSIAKGLERLDSTLEKFQGKPFLYAANVVTLRAEILWARKEWSRALEGFEKAEALWDEELARLRLSTLDLRSFLVQREKVADLVLNFYIALPEETGLRPRAALLVLDNIQRRKNRIFEQSSFERQLALDSPSLPVGDALRELAAVDRQLVPLLTNGATPGALSRLRATRLKHLRSLPSYEAEAQRGGTVDDLAAALSDSEVLVEYFLYHPYSISGPSLAKRWSPQPHYGAIVADNRGVLTVQELGRCDEMDRLIRHLQLSVQCPQARSWAQASKVVSRRLWFPIEQYISSASSVLISPESWIGLVPFGVLHDGQGKLLLESKAAIQFVFSARQLRQLRTVPPSSSPPAIFAQPDLNPKSSTPLRFSLGEARSVAASLGSQDPVISGSAFDRKRIEAVVSPSVLHFSTHGAYNGTDRIAAECESGQRSAKRARMSRTPQCPVGKVVSPEEAMALCSIAISGPRQTSACVADETYSALEASWLRLRGTQLAILSTCVGGYGKLEPHESIHGFPRALMMAGCRSVCFSLWSVDEKATATLIKTFVAELVNSTGTGSALRKAEALQRAQHQVAAAPATRHPYYWAGFQVVGDPHPLAV
jgi:CHAT domain-containing protein